MSYGTNSPDPAERLMASWGKWLTRVGLVIVVSGALLGVMFQEWPMFAVAVFGLTAFAFNRYVARKRARE